MVVEHTLVTLVGDETAVKINYYITKRSKTGVIKKKQVKK